MTIQLEVSPGQTLVVELTPPAESHQPWLLFLHGLGSSRGGKKAEVVAKVARERGLGHCTFDFRGHGDSTGTLEDWTPSGHLQDLRCVLHYLATYHSMQQVLLVGSSLGGWASAWHCVDQPKEVAGQLLVAPAFRIAERYWHRLSPNLQELWRRDGRFHFVTPWLDFHLSYACVQDGMRYRQDDLIARTRIPTWLLHGDQDCSVPIELSVEFADRVEGARLTIARGGNHRLTEHRDLLAQLIRNAAEELFGAPA